MEIKGTVTAVLPAETLNGGKTKQLFIVQQEGQYGKPCAIINFNSKFTTPQQGQAVTVSVNVESREYNGRWYTDLMGWKIEAGAMVESDNSSLPF